MKRILPLGLSLAALALPTAAWAAEPADTERLMTDLEAKPAARPIVQEPLALARKALARALNMDRAGDRAHAAAMRAAAREWVLLARDAVRAAEAESRATEAERTTHDLETRIVRMRALLEETVARRGRAKEALKQVGEAPPAPAPTAAPPAKAKTKAKATAPPGKPSP